ncbi:protein YgiW precursor [Photobacterium aquae]|uniref:Protein YgiW n=1 Tax=Photobacterium aquae TaxID=1195763 RepID=A0A0J1GWC8_9GAMM|nr:NirD/YgiW/YdeI family stress tolerance protein [Photobacterium aquae]KLV04023.1 protein YgiW precursor [Photobacterium aquae]
MKKIVATSLLLLASNSVLAAFNGSQIQPIINTISEIKNAPDDTHVVLTGHIVQSLGNEIYLFKDNTGEIKVDIDFEDWMGQDVTPKDKVTIRGEIDSEWSSSKIEVDSVQKV